MNPIDWRRELDTVDHFVGCRWTIENENSQHYFHSGYVRMSPTMENLFLYIWEWIKAVFSLDYTQFGRLVHMGAMVISFGSWYEYKTYDIIHLPHPPAYLARFKGAAPHPKYGEMENARFSSVLAKLKEGLLSNIRHTDIDSIDWDDRARHWRACFNHIKDNPMPVIISISEVVLNNRTVFFSLHFCGDPNVVPMSRADLEQNKILSATNPLVLLGQEISGIYQGTFYSCMG